MAVSAISSLWLSGIFTPATIAIRLISPVVRLALSRFEARGQFINHVDASLAANNFAAGMLGLDGCFDFHDLFLVRWGAFPSISTCVL